MEKKRIWQDFFVYSAGSYISQGLGVLTGFLLRTFLEPYYMGIWQGLNIIKNYTSYTNLGVSRSAAREIAYLRGKSEEIKSEILKNVGFTFTFIAISLVGIGCMLIALFLRKSINNYLFWGLLSMSLIVMLERMESYIVTILRAKKKFYFESLVKIINAFLYLIFVLLMVKNFKLYGLYLSNIFIYLISIILLVNLAKERFKFLLLKEELKRLVKIGGPLVLLGFMSVNLISIDRIVVIKMLGAKKLGFYSIATMMGNLIYNISNMAGIVLYPRFQELYGRYNEKKEVYIMMKKIIKFLVGPLSILVMVGIWFFPYLIKVFIPKYIEGITAMKILLIGMYFLSLSIFCGHFLITINKQVISLFICSIAIFINLILNVSFIKLGFDIEGVALATSVSYFIYFIFLFMNAYRYSK